MSRIYYNVTFRTYAHNLILFVPPMVIVCQQNIYPVQQKRQSWG